ncbi:MAG: DUF362 domain-containing protein [Candidatus Andersenbacteria bacterium]|nr:DUF362 domain-containing protein [Candidatus Andersenbacteria bacterium]
MTTNRIAIVTGRDTRQMVREVITALGDDFTGLVTRAQRIFIHPNLVSHTRAENCTQPDAVRGLLDHLQLHRADEMLVGDAGVRSTARAFRKLDFASLRRSGNIRLMDLNQDETIETYAYTARMKKRRIGWAKTVADSDGNIVIVPAKMHHYFNVTLSIKTQVVGSMIVPASPFGLHMRWPWVLTGYIPGNRTLADVYQQYPAQLAIIDGTHAMEGNGPTAGQAVNLEWVIASLNPVAADAAAAYLMGWEPHDIGYLHHLDGMGLGPIDIEKLEIIGPVPVTLRRELKKPDSYPATMSWREGESGSR